MTFWDVVCDSCNFLLLMIFVMLCDILNFHKLGRMCLSDTA